MARGVGRSHHHHHRRSRHRGQSARDPIVRASPPRPEKHRVDIYSPEERSEEGRPSYSRRGGDRGEKERTRDCFIARATIRGDCCYAASFAGERSSFDPARVPALPCRSRTKVTPVRSPPLPLSFSLGRRGPVIVMRGTYLYRKCVLFHRPRQRVQRTARCRASFPHPSPFPARARYAFYIFHFPSSAREGGRAVEER